MNIDGCRITLETDCRLLKGGTYGGNRGSDKGESIFGTNSKGLRYPAPADGRWPANVILSHAKGCELVGKKQIKGTPPHPVVSQIEKYPGYGTITKKSGEIVNYGDADGMETVENWHCVEDCPVRLLDEQTGELTSGANPVQRHSDITRGIYGAFKGHDCFPKRGADSGGASRFFYCAKADRAEREIGMESLEAKPLHWSSGDKNPGSFQAEGTAKQARNNHPTVKPIDLMAWLCRLVTPSGGLILDPFMGSGSTGIAALRCGFRFVGLDKEQKWVEVAARRIVGDAPLLNRPKT